MNLKIITVRICLNSQEYKVVLGDIMNIEKTKETNTIQESNNKHEKIINQMIGKYSAIYPINSVYLKAIFK